MAWDICMSTLGKQNNGMFSSLYGNGSVRKYGLNCRFDYFNKLLPMDVTKPEYMIVTESN